MTQTAERVEPIGCDERDCVAVSYSTHELDSRALRFPQQFLEEKGRADIDTIARDYGELILCLTDFDAESADRQYMLAGLVDHAESRGLQVTADLWNIGGNKNGESLTGGEGISLYGQNGGDLCLCNGDLAKLTDKMLGLVRGVGIERMFWDEPGVQCDHFKGNPEEKAVHDAAASLEFLDTYSQRATEEYGVDWNEACIRWRGPNREAAFRVASLKEINQISVAPYPLHPKNLKQWTADEVVGHVGPAYQAVADAAAQYHKTARGWVQGFNYSRENTKIMDVVFEQVGQRIGRVAVWSHDGSLHDPSLNSAVSMPPADIQAHILRNVRAFRADRSMLAA